METFNVMFLYQIILNLTINYNFSLILNYVSNLLGGI
jgi:hypothetical protein